MNSYVSDTAHDHMGDRITHIFRQILEIRTVEEDDNFFDLGGDSLMAENTVIALEKAFSVKLQTAVLLSAPTPRQLAEEIAKLHISDQWRQLVTRIPGCSGTNPAAMIHGMSGSPLFASRFGPKFKSRCQLFAIRGMGLFGEELPLQTAPEILSAYASGLEAITENNPRIYGGICIGGLVAMGLAQAHFLKTGEQPTMILVDPPPLGSVWFKPVGKEKHPHARVEQLLRQAKFWSKLRNFLIGIGLGETALGRKARREMFKKHLSHAFAGYVPDPFPCRLLLIASSEWGTTTIQQYQNWAPDAKCITIKGNHGGFQTASTAQIDNEIAAFLDQDELTTGQDTL